MKGAEIFFYSVLLIINKGLGTAKKHFSLYPDRMFDIPINPKKPTHIFLKSGKLSFGVSDLKSYFYRSRRGRFFLIPDEAVFVSFPKYKFEKCNNFYGLPTWFNADQKVIPTCYPFL